MVGDDRVCLLNTRFILRTVLILSISQAELNKLNVFYTISTELLLLCK